MSELLQNRNDEIAAAPDSGADENAAGQSRRDFLLTAKNVAAALVLATSCAKAERNPNLVSARVALQGGAEYVVRDRLHTIYLPESLTPELVVRSAPAVPRPAGKNFALACAGPFFDQHYGIVGKYVADGKRFEGEPVNYINGQFAQGFFAVDENGKWHISPDLRIMQGEPRMGFEQFLIVKDGKLAGELGKFVGTDTGTKFLRRYLCEFGDESFAVSEVNSLMTHANAGDYLLKKARSRSGRAQLKNALYLDMGIASAALVQEADGAVFGLPQQKGDENFPASFLVFKSR